MPIGKKIGAFWVKCSKIYEDDDAETIAKKKKKKFLSGVIEVGDIKLNVVMFPNGYKKKDTHPDWIMKESNFQGSGGNFEDDEEIPF